MLYPYSISKKIIMPELNEIRKSREIGYKSNGTKWIWLACPNCGKQRWVPLQKDQPKYHLCQRCQKPKGEANPNWKGGRSKHSGYILIYAPNHPKAVKGRYVYEHILVWERTHNTSLPDGWIIHHINGIKDDNRPRNLIALSKGKHHYNLLLNALKERIRELETENKLLEKALDNSQMIFRIEEN